MRNLETGVEFEWPKDKFLNRMYVMKEMYQNYEAGEEWDVDEVNEFLILLLFLYYYVFYIYIR